ncbi:hypothetical protein BsWGS_00796 [Bradybaena similaris]
MGFRSNSGESKGSWCKTDHIILCVIRSISLMHDHYLINYQGLATAPCIVVLEQELLSELSERSPSCHRDCSISTPVSSPRLVTSNLFPGGEFRNSSQTP